jgi:hypothetical protein
MAVSSELTQRIGSGALEVSFIVVLTHATAHGIDLGRSDEGQSVMGSSLETARCDDRTIAALAGHGAVESKLDLGHS